MDFVDPALLADLIFQWQELTPVVCTDLTDGVDQNLQWPQSSTDHSNLVDGMLLDFELPAEVITVDLPELPSALYPAIATPVVKASWSPISPWPCNNGAPPSPLFADILQVVAVSTDQRGLRDTGFDVSLVEVASASPSSFQVVPCAPFTSPPAPVKQLVSRRSVTKRSEPLKSNAALKAPSTVTNTKILVDAKHFNPSTAPTTLADHIMRERRRRDDMATKYFVLESLLPPASKRDRAVVVVDATLLVRALLQKKAQLLKRRAHLKLVGVAPGSAKKMRPSWTSGQALWHKQLPIGPHGGACNIKQQSNGVHKLEPDCSKLVPQLGIIANAIDVHAGNEDVVVEIVWNRPPPNFESRLLLTVETLGLEVTRCSILRAVTGFVQCFITCSKPQVPSQPKLEIVQSSEISIMEALRDLLTQSR